MSSAPGQPVRVAFRDPRPGGDFTVRQVSAAANASCQTTGGKHRRVVLFCVVLCVVQLKWGLAEHLGVPPELLVLVQSGRDLNESELVSHLKRQDGSVTLGLVRR